MPNKPRSLSVVCDWCGPLVDGWHSQECDAAHDAQVALAEHEREVAKMLRREGSLMQGGLGDPPFASNMPAGLNKPRAFINDSPPDRLIPPTELPAPAEIREMMARAVDQSCIEQVTLETAKRVQCATCGDMVYLAETIICQCPCECQERICYTDAKLGLYECPDCSEGDKTC